MSLGNKEKSPSHLSCPRGAQTIQIELIVPKNIK